MIIKIFKIEDSHGHVYFTASSDMVIDLPQTSILEDFVKKIEEKINTYFETDPNVEISFPQKDEIKHSAGYLPRRHISLSKRERKKFWKLYKKIWKLYKKIKLK